LMSALTMITRDKGLLAGLLMYAFFSFIALTAPYISPYDPFALVGEPYVPPSPKHILGTDNLGRDVLSQVIWGSRISLLVGVAVALGISTIGVLVGLLAATSRRAVDETLMRLCDVIIAIPKLPLLITLSAIVRPGVWVIVAILIAFFWTDVARIVRSEALSIKQRPYVDAARMAGAGTAKIAFLVILPNILPLVVATGILSIITGILYEASISFLGLGNPLEMSWGTVIHYAWIGGAIYKECWAWILTPGFCIAAVGVATNLVGSRIGEVLNPRLRVQG